MKIRTTRTILFMSMCTIWGFIFSFVTATALMAGTTSAQSVKDVVISVRFDETSLQEAFHQIEQKTDFKFLYEKSFVETNDKRITLHQTTSSVEKILFEISKQTGLGFRQVNNTLAVKTPEEVSNTNDWLSFSEALSGSVTDAQSGEPMPGVNIRVKGANIGTSTNAEGYFELDVPTLQDTLIFSFVGYKQLEIPINSRTQIDVEMDMESLSEDFVVTALGINRSQRSIGYATQEITGDNLTYSDENNVIGSLAGKIAGVQVSGSSGASMGGTKSIKIRGVNSINGEGQPLVVIDGTPISNANFAGSAGADYGNLAQDINSDDIQSINVLKGPAASSLYGIRGQYGVIMITTNKGTAGNVEVKINSNLSFQQSGNFLEYQNKYGGGSTQTWRTLPNGQKYVQTNLDESWGPRMDGTLVREYFSFYPQDPDYGKLTPFDPHPDNVKNFFETGYTADNSVSVSGGNSMGNYRISFNDTKITGVYPNTYLNRNNLGVSANIKPSNQWRFSANVNYATNDSRRPPQGSQYGSRYFRQWFQRNLDMKRLKNYQYSDGTVKHWNMRSPSSSTGEIANLSALYWPNPYFEAYENTAEDGRDRVFGNVGAHFEALPNLVLSANIRGDIYVQEIVGKSNFGGTSRPGYSVGKYQNKEMNYELSAKYQKSWEKISLDATAGTNIYDRDYSYLSQATVGGLTSPGYFNIDASVDRPSVNSYLQNKRIVSAYGLVSLGFDQTYFLDVSLRSDRSSTLPENENTYLYPSVSGSFIFSELLDMDALTFGKLRASYAQAGSDLSPYQTTPVYSIGTVYDGMNTLSVPNNINNPEIKPSFSTSYEAGIDVRFFERIGMSFTYYLQRNENQIIPLNISGTTGYSSAIINAGLIENSGIELSLDGTPIQQKDFVWNSTFNISRNTNQVVRLHPDIDLYQHDYTVYSSTRSYLNSYEGKTYGSLVGRAYERDPATGKKLLDDDNMPIWTDATHNFGTVLPDFTGGFQNLFFYKNFSLSTMISFQIGGQFFSRSEMLATRTGLHKRTAALNDKGNNVREPVSQGGGVKVNGISKTSGQEVTAYVDASDYFDLIGDEVYEDWVIDATYIKLGEVKLGYSLDKRLLSKLPVKDVKVALFANNPLMIWQKAPAGLDPSELSTGSQDITWYESGQLNTVRSYGLNVKLTF